VFPAKTGANYLSPDREVLLMVNTELAGVVVSALTPLVVAGLGIWFNHRLNRIERRHKHRIEFTVEANFHGPKKGFHVAEFLIHVHNKSNVRYESERIGLRVRGLKRGDAPKLWRGGDRLEFPDKLLDTNVLPNAVFIEPDVDQPITFVTRVGQAYDYVLATAEFSYRNADLEPHTAERVFAVNPGSTA
jgi:hypothetical protein